MAARKSGLKYYWGNFGGLKSSYFLFVGTQLGIMGFENAQSISISLDDFRESIDITLVKLLGAGFEETPSVHIQWQPE